MRISQPPPSSSEPPREPSPLSAPLQPTFKKPTTSALGSSSPTDVINEYINGPFQGLLQAVDVYAADPTPATLQNFNNVLTTNMSEVNTLIATLTGAPGVTGYTLRELWGALADMGGAYSVANPAPPPTTTPPTPPTPPDPAAAQQFITGTGPAGSASTDLNNAYNGAPPL